MSTNPIGGPLARAKKSNSKSTTNGATVGYEAQLWQMAAKQRAAAIAAARTLADHALTARVAGPSPGARVEVPFIVRLDRLLVRGIIDRLDTTADGTTITDYKVGERIDDHIFQVQAYLWAARRAGVSEPLRGRGVYLRESGVEVVEVPEGEGVDRIALDLESAVALDRFDVTASAV